MAFSKPFAPSNCIARPASTCPPFIRLRSTDATERDPESCSPIEPTSCAVAVLFCAPFSRWETLGFDAICAFTPSSECSRDVFHGRSTDTTASTAINKIPAYAIFFITHPIITNLTYGGKRSPYVKPVKHRRLKAANRSFDHWRPGWHRQNSAYDNLRATAIGYGGYAAVGGRNAAVWASYLQIAQKNRFRSLCSGAESDRQSCYSEIFTARLIVIPFP